MNMFLLILCFLFLLLLMLGMPFAGGLIVFLALAMSVWLFRHLFRLLKNLIAKHPRGGWSVVGLGLFLLSIYALAGYEMLDLVLSMSLIGVVLFGPLLLNSRTLWKIDKTYEIRHSRLSMVWEWMEDIFHEQPHRWDAEQYQSLRAQFKS